MYTSLSLRCALVALVSSTIQMIPDEKMNENLQKNADGLATATEIRKESGVAEKESPPSDVVMMNEKVESTAGSGALSQMQSCVKNFAPFLHASQEYSEISGYRFRSSSFGVDFDAVEVLDREAKLRAAPAVHSFAERLRAGDSALLEELDRAFRIVMAESVRNSIMSNCQQLGIFPPQPRPDNIDDDDCTYEDVSAPLPVIAQRLYNDKVRRQNVVGTRLEKRAMTAAYIVDFAAETGVCLPKMPEIYMAMLQDFSERVSDWEAQHEPIPRDSHEVSLQSRESQEHFMDGNRWWEDSFKLFRDTDATSLMASCVGVRAGRDFPSSKS